MVVDIFGTDKKYQIIYADPPWQFKNYNDKTATLWVGQQYPLMTLEGIKALRIDRISADNSILFLWATFPTLPTAFEVISSWGFNYKTVAFTWVKMSKGGNTLKRMGYWTRSNAEVCLLATKGHPRRVDTNTSQVVMTVPRQHSKKPNEVRDRIVQLMGDLPRIELFARQQVDGWDCWGNEVEEKPTA